MPANSLAHQDAMTTMKAQLNAADQMMFHASMHGGMSQDQVYGLRYLFADLIKRLDNPVLLRSD